ncbi:oligosaccharide flippase family protein [Paenibacillus sp. GYB003]|uniref:oligosaccharide flippase family protein n=1 Tax=Paenibacillus sp. GYB003 TaxID=2994392 RepID=UPI002F9672A7
MNSGSLLKHTITRSGVLILVKVMGIAARIPLIRLLGPEGTGLYQMAYACYGFGLTVVSGGFPTSLALTTAENRALGRRLFKRSAFLLFGLGLLMGAFCYRFADGLAESLGNAHLAFPIRCLSPAIAIVPLLSLFRGYMQGRNSHGLIAVSELIEQTVRLSLMLLLVFAWIPYGLPSAIGGAMLGAFAGAAAAIAFMAVATRLLSESGESPELMPPDGAKKQMTAFVYSSLTLAATRFIVPLSDFLDAYIVPNRLQAAGYSLSEAVSVFGELSGMGGLIVYMPTLITSALAFTLSPKLVADRMDRKTHRFRTRSEAALRFGWLWGIASAWVLYAYADPLARLFFHDASIAKAIRCMAVIPIFAGFRELSTIVLWAKGDKIRPLQGLMGAVVGSLAFSYILIGIPGLGYAGAVIGMVSLEAIAALWNAKTMKKAYRLAVPWKRSLAEAAKLLLCLAMAEYGIRALFACFSLGDRWAIVQMIVVSLAGVGYIASNMRLARNRIV